MLDFITKVNIWMKETEREGEREKKNEVRENVRKELNFVNFEKHYKF